MSDNLIHWDVCYDCKVVSGHSRVWCPSCPKKMVRVWDTYDNLRKRFPLAGVDDKGDHLQAEDFNRYDRQWVQK